MRIEELRTAVAELAEAVERSSEVLIEVEDAREIERLLWDVRSAMILLGRESLLERMGRL